MYVTQSHGDTLMCQTWYDYAKRQNVHDTLSNNDGPMCQVWYMPMSKQTEVRVGQEDVRNPINLTMTSKISISGSWMYAILINNNNMVMRIYGMTMSKQ